MDWKISILYPGDHIRVKRDHYHHHGIYIGNGEVIHFTAEKDDGINSPKEVLVRKTSIQFFLKDGVAERAIYTRKEKRSLNRPEEIIKKANESLGQGNYDIIINNCEDFANSVKYKKSKNSKHYFNIFRFIARFFIKVTGIIPYLIIVSPRRYYVSKKANKESKKIKGGAIIVSNHTSIFDYYIFIFRYFFRVIHTMVAEVIYKYKSLGHLCRVLENIMVDRNDPSNIKAYRKSREYLNNGKSVLIFPEGKLEDKCGVIEEIKPSAILLSFETNKPIIPYFLKGNYGLFKRAKYIVGEKIYVRDLIKKDRLESEDIKLVQEYLKKQFKILKRKLTAIEKQKTQALISRKLYVLDFIKITSIPIGFLVLRAKKYYLGNKKEIKKILKDKVLIAPNHTSMIDVIFMYLYFFSRRIRILALNNIWNVKILAFAFNRAGVIKYNRESPGGFDLLSFKETNEILDGGGAVVMFPQGHISKDGLINGKSDIKPGLALHSLQNNAPIVPVFFADVTTFSKLNRIIIGEPIYPSNYFDVNENINSEKVNQFNDIIAEKMLDLQEKAKKFSRSYKKQKEIEK